MMIGCVFDSGQQQTFELILVVFFLSSSSALLALDRPRLAVHD